MTADWQVPEWAAVHTGSQHAVSNRKHATLRMSSQLYMQVVLTVSRIGIRDRMSYSSKQGSCALQ